MPTIADRLREARQAAGLSQEDAGTLIGRTRQAVSDWEAGRTTIPADYAAAIAKASGWSGHYLLLGDGEKELPRPAADAVDEIRKLREEVAEYQRSVMRRLP